MTRLALTFGDHAMKTQFNRRHVLRGTGALIALPALESVGFRRFASAATLSATPPKRMVCLGIGFGVTKETWFPDLADNGPGYKLPEGLSPLARHKSDFTVVQGCANKFSNEAHWGSTFWLTGRIAMPFPGRTWPTAFPSTKSLLSILGGTRDFPRCRWRVRITRDTGQDFRSRGTGAVSQSRALMIP